MGRRPRAEGGQRSALRRLLPLLVPVATAGAAVVAASVVEVALDPPTPYGWLGLLALVAAALVAEESPVPVQNLPAGHVSLAAVFFVGTGVAGAMIGTDGDAQLVVAVVAASAMYYVVNVVLIAAAIGRWADRPFLP